MKKLILLLVLCGAMPLTMMAQDDDLYFTPKKSAKAERAEVVYDNRPAATARSMSTTDVDAIAAPIRPSVVTPWQVM